MSQKVAATDVLSVVSWNAENLAPLLRAEALHSLAEVHHAFGGPDVLCLQEIRLRPSDAALLACLGRALPGFTCRYHLNHDLRNAPFRGGRAYGVATWVRDSLQPTAAIIAPWDREGRVVGTLLRSWNIALFNVYAVNGTSRPYVDPDTGAPLGDRHCFKRRFITRLAQFIAPLQRDFDLLLIGDWNVAQTRADTWPRLRTEQPHAEARQAFRDELVAPFRLTDAYRAAHPERRQYTWFNPRARGNRLDAARVDFALVSDGLAPRVVATSIDEAPSARFGSDHAPIAISLRRGEADASARRG